MTNITNMPELTINSRMVGDNKIPGVKDMLNIAHTIKDSVMLHGAPGIGKSQGVYQWNADKVEEYTKAGKKWNPVVCDVRLSMKEPVDMVGIPVLSKDEKGKTVTVWATPSMWPQGNEFDGGTIFLDEINQGQAAIQNAAFQLIQDRALGEYKVPEGYLIVAAANPSAYNPTVTEFSIPLSNRFTHFNVKADFESWLDYRLNNNGNLDVMSFLKTQGPDLLFDTKTMEKKIGDDLSNAIFDDVVITPRSWEVVEKVLNLSEDKYSLIEKKMYCTGRLGLATSNKLFDYIKNKTKYQSWEEILKDGKAFKSEELDGFWVTQMACVQTIINEKDDTKCRDYIVNYIKAIRELKSAALKATTFIELCNCKRVLGNLSLFNPLKDGGDLIQYMSRTLNQK